MGKLSDFQKIEIVNGYRDGKSCGQLSKEFGVGRSNIRGILMVRGVVLRSREEATRKHVFNYRYFDRIDSEEKAYWLGFVVAEGNVSYYTLGIELGAVDRDHLKKFASAVGYEYFDDYREEKDSYRVRLNSKYLVEKLLTWGVGEKKSDKIMVPSIPEDLLRHFFRGFVDGDGSFTKRYNKKASARIVKKRNRKTKCAKYTTLTMNAASDSLQFLLDFREWVRRELCREVGYISSREQGGKMRHKLDFGGNVLAVQVACLLYDDHRVAMDRKVKSYEEYLRLSS